MGNFSTSHRTLLDIGKQICNFAVCKKDNELYLAKVYLSSKDRYNHLIITPAGLKRYEEDITNDILCYVSITTLQFYRSGNLVATVEPIPEGLDIKFNYFNALGKKMSDSNYDSPDTIETLLRHQYR